MMLMMVTTFFSVPGTLQDVDIYCSLLSFITPDSLMVTMYFWYDVNIHDDDAFLFLKTIPWLLYIFHNDDNDAFLIMRMMHISWRISYNDDDDDAFLNVDGGSDFLLIISLFISQFWWCFCTSQCFHDCYAFLIILMMMLIHL